ncbi:hypothetical protein ACFY41_23805 [Streptomyces syringium]
MEDTAAQRRCTYRGPQGARRAARPYPGGMSTAPEPTPKPRNPAALIFDDPLSQQSSDDTDRGWGDRPSGGDSAGDLARFLDEKPPHHI